MPPSLPVGPDHAAEAVPAIAAGLLGPHDIHLWWLPYQRAYGRRPLLELLGAYLHTDPASLSLETGVHGRPHLAQDMHDLDFNWSHSGSTAVVAIAQRLPLLGVDVEGLKRSHLDPLALAKRFFADQEYAALAALPEADRRAAFRRLWTAKEAVLKAHGRGLSYGLERVAFRLKAPHWYPATFYGDIGAAAQWQLQTWPVNGGDASLAWCGGERQVRHHRWQQKPSR